MGSNGSSGTSRLSSKNHIHWQKFQVTGLEQIEERLLSPRHPCAPSCWGGRAVQSCWGALRGCLDMRERSWGVRAAAGRVFVPAECLCWGQPGAT